MATCSSSEDKLTNASVSSPFLSILALAVDTPTPTITAKLPVVTSNGADAAPPPHVAQSGALVVWETIAITSAVLVVITIATVVIIALLWRQRKVHFRAKKEKAVHCAPPPGLEGSHPNVSSESISEGSLCSGVRLSRPMSSEIFLPGGETLHKRQHDVISMDPSRAGGVWF